MITTEATRAAFPLQDFTAGQARALLDQIAETFPAVGPLTSGQLAGVLTLAWQAGYAAAHVLPACDWCGAPVATKLAPELGYALWTHRDTGLYSCADRYVAARGCDPRSTSDYAQVDGSGKPQL